MTSAVRFSPLCRAVALLALAGFLPLAAADPVLVPPPGFTQAVTIKHGSSQQCDPVPAPYTGELDFPSRYEGSGSSRDQVNEQASAENKRLTAPIHAMEKGFESMVRKYMRSGEPATLACAMDWLGTWADAKALEGAANNHQGRSMRKWTLAGLSSVYLHLKFSSTAPLLKDAERAGKIETWFSDVADIVVKEWPPDAPLQKINNHSYWVGWSLMSTAVATNRRDLFDRALVFYRIFEKQVDADGYLPNELARKTRALAYHAYALAPLAMIAAFAKANGIDLALEGDRALARLADRVFIGLDDPASFAIKTGVQQDPEALSEQGQWAWIEPYCWTVRCEPTLAAQLAEGRSRKSTRLGGDLTAIFAAGSTP